MTLFSEKQRKIIDEKAGENEQTKGRSAFMRPWIKGDTDMMKAGVTSECFLSKMKRIISLCLEN